MLHTGARAYTQERDPGSADQPALASRARPLSGDFSDRRKLASVPAAAVAHLNRAAWIRPACAAAPQGADSLSLAPTQAVSR